VLTTQGDEKTGATARVDDTGSVTPFKESTSSVGTAGRVAAVSRLLMSASSRQMPMVWISS
jgi:hypothetical protein